MKFRILHLLLVLLCAVPQLQWGFVAHRKINEMAVFTLPPEMIRFYKQNLEYIRDHSVSPDKRRYTVPDEGPRHYLDLDHYGDSATHILPMYWSEAEARFGEDSLNSHGVLPWHIYRVFGQLRMAFVNNDVPRILRYSADLGHYVADAHVPLHTTTNYDGQLTGQFGIHGLWESRLPELYMDEYSFLVGGADYVENPQHLAWKIVLDSHALVGTVLSLERSLTNKYGETKYTFEERGKQIQKVVSQEFSSAYHDQLGGMVEQRMRASVKVVGDLWYTAWVEAGQPDLNKLGD